MSHPEQMAFIELVKHLAPRYFQGTRVLEIGSLDINGSIRGCFSDCEYLGLDIASGKGVDVVCEGQAYDAPEGSFDVVVSCEAMEHNPHWAETMANMFRLVRPGGLVMMTCATVGRKEHGTAKSEPSSSPLTVEKGWDYYRNLTWRDLKRHVDFSPLMAWSHACNWRSYDLYFLGLKHSEDPEDAAAGVKLVSAVTSAYRKRTWSSLRWLRRSIREHLKYCLFGRA